VLSYDVVRSVNTALDGRRTIAYRRSDDAALLITGDGKRDEDRTLSTLRPSQIVK